MFAPGVSAAELLAASRAPECPQTQYHRGLEAETALRLESQIRAAHPVSREAPAAVSGSMAFQIDGLIQRWKCQSIVSRNASQIRRDSVVYSRSKVLLNSGSNRRVAQYQTRRARYQPGQPVSIEAVVTKSAQLPDTGRGDTRLMLKIGLLLGLAYVIFLTIWFWATRVRLRPSGRGIDTGRRIE